MTGSLLALQTGNDGSLDYDAFLREKVAFDRSFGFEVTDDDLSPIFRAGHPLFQPHQADVVKWAVAGGRRAAPRLGTVRADTVRPAERRMDGSMNRHYQQQTGAMK